MLAAGTSIACQYVLNKQPCELCLLSRYIYVAIVAISILAIRYVHALFLRNVLITFVFCSFLAGTYHLGVENHWWAAPKFCSLVLPDQEELNKPVPSNFLEGHVTKCDAVNLEILGFSATLLNWMLSSALFWFLSVSYAIEYGRKSMQIRTA
jgi:disulfide bond formation protein DsbB